MRNYRIELIIDGPWAVVYIQDSDNHYKLLVRDSELSGCQSCLNILGFTNLGTAPGEGHICVS